MSGIEFGVVQQPKGNGGKQSETETSTKSPTKDIKPKSADNLPQKGRGD